MTKVGAVVEISGGGCSSLISDVGSCKTDISREKACRFTWKGSPPRGRRPSALLRPKRWQ